MAGGTDLAKKLVGIFRTLDDEAYIAYANKGLLRRARKEIKKGAEVALLKTGDDSIELSVSGHAVVLDESGLSTAKCGCPSPGSCQHIIMACLLLEELTGISAQDGEEKKETETPGDDRLEITEEALRKFAGAEMFRKGCHFALNECKGVDGERVSFLNDIQCRLVGGAGVEGIIVNSGPKLRKAYAVAAVLAYQKESGVKLTLDFSKASSRLLMDISLLEELMGFLEQTMELGLNHLSLSMLKRMKSLAVRLRVGGLVRPSLELSGCVKEIEYILHRHAREDISKLFNKMAMLYALCESVKNQGQAATEDYVGKARSKYHRVNRLGLVGMGAYPWETESGFTGLTALFWSPGEEAFFSWSDSRPKETRGSFSPKNRFEEGAPWSAGGPLKDICGSSFRLKNPKTNEKGRLSAHEGCKVADIPRAIKAEELPPSHTNWEILREEQRKKQPAGLLRGSPLDALCLIRPAAWGRPFFDETEQCLMIPLEDNEGSIITVMLPFSEMTAPAVYYLESCKKNGNLSVFGYFRQKPTESIFPVSLIYENENVEVVHLMFKPMPKKRFTFKGMVMERIRSFIPLPQSDEDSLPQDLNDMDNISLFLSPLDDYLLSLSESGMGNHEKGRKAPDMDMSAAGFILLGKMVENMATARDLLISRYLYLLHMDLR